MSEGQLSYEELLIENQRLSEQVADLSSSIGWYFDIRAIAGDQSEKHLVDGFMGYLRVCQSGGMSAEDSDAYASVFKNFARVCSRDLIFPHLLFYAAMYRDQLTPPYDKTRKHIEDRDIESALELIEKHLSEGDVDGGLSKVRLLIYRVRNRADTGILIMKDDDQ